MEGLVEELSRRGALDQAAVKWANDYQAEHGGNIDTILLELDLVDEEVLLEALGSVTGLRPVSAGDLGIIDTELGERLPESFGRSFGLCPLHLAGSELVGLVRAPLEEESLGELRELFSLELRQLVATNHHLAVVSKRVYGSPIDARTEALESRLVRRRGADVRRVLAAVSAATGLRAAALEILDFAGKRLDYASLLVCADDEISVAAEAGARAGDQSRIPMPEPGATLWAALRNAGYFVGQIVGTPADEAFFGALGRPLPRWALVAPVPVSGDRMVAFYADNGSRGIATRWVAELSLLVARLVEQPSRSGPEPPSAPRERESPHPAAEEPAIGKLRVAAEAEGLTLDAFVDLLLRERAQPLSPPAPSAALAGEVKDLFEKLAADIPTQLARGMENAFRDMMPRLAASGPAVEVPGASPSRSRGAAAADLLVVSEAKPKEVADYRSRRRKTKRVKL